MQPPVFAIPADANDTLNVLIALLYLMSGKDQTLL